MVNFRYVANFRFLTLTVHTDLNDLLFPVIGNPDTPKKQVQTNKVGLLYMGIKLDFHRLLNQNEFYINFFCFLDI